MLTNRSNSPSNSCQLWSAARPKAAAAMRPVRRNVAPSGGAASSRGAAVAAAVAADAAGAASTTADAAASSSSTMTAAAPQQQQQLPATFKRLVADRVADSFRAAARVEEAPLAELLGALGPGEVLVRVAFAGVNGGCETFRARGEHAFRGNRARERFALGAEGAGTVAALGEGVTSLSVGDAVAVNGAAAFAEFVVAKAPMCTRVPAATPEAVALVLSAVTACCALEATARAAPGQTVAVTAAAGGTGHFAVQLAKLAGCRVVAVTGSPGKVARLEAELGADAVVCAAGEADLAAAVMRAAPGGVDVVYEGVGGAVGAALLGCLAPGGKLLQVGYISEYPHALAPGAAVSAPAAGVPPLDAVFWEGRRVELGGGREVIGQVWPSDPRAIRRCKRRVFDLHAEGRLTAWTDLSHGFRGVGQVADAVDYMLQGGHVGKVVIPIAV